MSHLNTEVTQFLDGIHHPLRGEIEALRYIILNSDAGLMENIKWNSPNYCYREADRITMKIQPPKQIQLIFHRGAKKQVPPKEKLIQTPTNLLTWKENDRAIASFKGMTEIQNRASEITEIVKQWIATTNPK